MDSMDSFSRRDLLKTAGQVAAVASLANLSIPHVHAAETGAIQIALVGCGGRGTGAARNAIENSIAPTKLVAMADVFPKKLQKSYEALKTPFEKQIDVPTERQFIGFDAYRQAMDCLRPGDIVILATPPAFRWVQFQYAIEKGLHVFMEKPISVDGPTTRKMMALGETASQRNLKVAVGLMCRHCDARQELYERIKSGEIGDITLLRAYRLGGPVGSTFATEKPDDLSELLYQVKNFHAFLWASGGAFSDMLIHNIDESCWMKDAWPVEAKGFGGRHFRGNYMDQNFDTYTTEYTFADGTKLLLEGRSMPNCHVEFASYAHGTKGSAVISTSSHTPAKCRTYRGQNMTKDNLLWQARSPEPSPYQLEWNDLIKAIVSDLPYNETQRGAEASLVTAMGRMACHTGQVVTFEEALNHEHEFAPDVDKLTMDSPAPLQTKSSGKYPTPQPGLLGKREYL